MYSYVPPLACRPTRRWSSCCTAARRAPPRTTRAAAGRRSPIATVSRVLLPQQQWNNNPLRCFNWFKPEDNERERGEPLSISQMVDRMVDEHGVDARRVYVTGTSSGGAMTTVLLATYPEVFAGGAVLAGVPYRTASGLQEGLESIFQGRSRSAGEWGELVRAASPHQGPWPKVSVWHGDADTAVKPVNAEEIIKQWTDLHGLDLQPTIQMTVDGYPRRVWQGADGDELIESYTITGMAHGAALDPGAEPHQCGTAAPFFNAVGISSTHRIADFWGLLAERPAAAQRRASPSRASAGAGSAESGERMRQGRTRRARAADEATLRSVRARSTCSASNRPFGLDVHGIISASLEAAGLLKPGRHVASPGQFGTARHRRSRNHLDRARSRRGAQGRHRLQRSPGSAARSRACSSAGWEGTSAGNCCSTIRAPFAAGSMLHGQAVVRRAGCAGTAHAVDLRGASCSVRSPN
jgi:poly(hydroxyalkanoate) depolymerase family esterase